MTPAEVSETLATIAREKRAHVDKHGKQRPEHWHEHYRRQIEACEIASGGYARMAERAG